jgi:dihydrodipicolinate synthase/N-acetylneuraminate lyase
VDWYSVEALLAGGDAWYSVLAGLFPHISMEIVQAVQSGNAAEARRLNAHLQPLWDLFKEFSSLARRLRHRRVARHLLCRAAATDTPAAGRRSPDRHGQVEGHGFALKAPRSLRVHSFA